MVGPIFRQRRRLEIDVGRALDQTLVPMRKSSGKARFARLQIDKTMAVEGTHLEHLDRMLQVENPRCDLVVFDPAMSPRLP